MELLKDCLLNCSPTQPIGLDTCEIINKSQKQSRADFAQHSDHVFVFPYANKEDADDDVDAVQIVDVPLLELSL